MASNPNRTGLMVSRQSYLLHSMKMSMLTQAMKDQDNPDDYTWEDCERIVHPYGIGK